MKCDARWKMHGRWIAMIRRCCDEQAAGYKNYGGRGITVCERWLNSFDAYVDDVGLPPSDEMTVDRIDNDGNYEPGNVRWATRQQQLANRRPSSCWAKSTGRPMSYPGEGRSIRMSASLPESLAKRLETAAKQTGKSQSAIVVAGLRAILSQTPDRLREQIGG